MSVVSGVCYHRFLRRADPSSRGDLQNVVCLLVISMPGAMSRGCRAMKEKHTGSSAACITEM